MAADNLQLQRFELKYIITEERALQVRNFVQSYLEIDEFGATQPNLSYTVHSLYLDSDSLSFYWHTINGNKNRYKLRLRFYDNRPESPVYFEIKRRVNNAILKQRGSVRRDTVPSILSGHFPDPAQMLSADPKHLVAVQRFVQLMNENHVTPKAHVAYLREAWVSTHNNAVRVTIDRDVHCEPEPTARFEKSMQNPVRVFGNRVVLELKFTGRFPDWFREMVQVLGITQASAAKYADGVALAGEHRFADPSATAAHEHLARVNLAARRKYLAETLSNSRIPAFA